MYPVRNVLCAATTLDGVCKPRLECIEVTAYLKTMQETSGRGPYPVRLRYAAVPSTLIMTTITPNAFQCVVSDLELRQSLFVGDRHLPEYQGYRV